MCAVSEADWNGQVIRFTASQWNASRGKDIPWIVFGMAMDHLRGTEAIKSTVAGPRGRPMACWACDGHIEPGESYKATRSDRRMALGAHEECLAKVREWADRQEKANLKRLGKKTARP
jgi:hypothetical protein